MPKNIASLFSGCGGLDLGFSGGFVFRNTVCERLDTNIVFANDFDRDAWACYNNNELLTNDGVHSRLGDIREIPTNEIPNFDILIEKGYTMTTEEELYLKNVNVLFVKR